MIEVKFSFLLKDSMTEIHKLLKIWKAKEIEENKETSSNPIAPQLSKKCNFILSNENYR